jgi:hypothetical protein
MPAAREAVALGADLCCADFGGSPSESAALAVPSAVRVPEERRTESIAGRRFFLGEVAGVEKVADDLRDVRVMEWEEARGDGVRLVARWDEMRADFLGEKGSQESL